MNNKLEVIGIDHGWSMMKTISQVFVTGVKEITTTPALFGDVLEYEGKFYKVGAVRQEVKDTKVEDDSFYLLTLAAVAKELKRRGLAEAKVFLAVGLPLTRFVLKMAYFYSVVDSTNSTGENAAPVNNTEYAFQLEIDTSKALPESLKIFNIQRVGVAVWNTERSKIISQMNLYKPEDLLKEI